MMEAAATAILSSVHHQMEYNLEHFNLSSVTTSLYASVCNVLCCSLCYDNQAKVVNNYTHKLVAKKEEKREDVRREICSSPVHSLVRLLHDRWW
jgi:hypothetical protein